MLKSVREIKTDYPQITIGTCNCCAAPLLGICRLAELEIKLGRVPTAEDAKQVGIDPEKIVGLYCPNGYTSSNNSGIF